MGSQVSSNNMTDKHNKYVVFEYSNILASSNSLKKITLAKNVIMFLQTKEKDIQLLCKVFLKCQLNDIIHLQCINAYPYQVSNFLYLYVQSNLVILNSDNSFLQIFRKLVYRQHFSTLFIPDNSNISNRKTSKRFVFYTTRFDRIYMLILTISQVFQNKLLLNLSLEFQIL